MKKCPFCHADIEDNARFCLYCMSSLEDKKIIENEQEKNKRWLYIIAAFLLLAVALIIILITIPKDKIDNNSSLPILQNNIIFNDDSSDDNVPSGENGDKNSNSKNEKPDNTTTQQSGGSSDKTENGGGLDSEDNSDNDDSSSTPVSSSSPSSPSKTSSTPSQDDGSGESSTDQGSSEAAPVKTEAVYIYRDAIAKDCYTKNNIPASYAPTQSLEDVIVITGVSVAASDGVYVIPEKIGDKKVGAVMQSAFCDSNIAATVKKVVIPSTVKTIWENAFSSCYNLTDIYLKGITIEIFESAFADTSKRTGALTIHCLHDCKNFDYYYYRNIASRYGAQYKNWNGGEIE